MGAGRRGGFASVQKIASRAPVALRQCPEIRKISLCEKSLGFGERETRATLRDPGYPPLFESEPSGLVEEAAALVWCVCGQEVAPGLSVFGSLLCHDCRGDSRRLTPPSAAAWCAPRPLAG